MQLVFSYYSNAERMGMFSKEEFTSVLMKLGCDTIDKLRERLPELAAELDSDVVFRRVYEFAFVFAREVHPTQIRTSRTERVYSLGSNLSRRQWRLRCGG